MQIGFGVTPEKNASIIPLRYLLVYIKLCLSVCLVSNHLTSFVVWREIDGDQEINDAGDENAE